MNHVVTTIETWGEMTDADKGALLLAAHDGNTIQSYHSPNVWEDVIEFAPVGDIAYRIKPEARYSHKLDEGQAPPYPDRISPTCSETAMPRST